MTELNYSDVPRHEAEQISCRETIGATAVVSLLKVTVFKAQRHRISVLISMRSRVCFFLCLHVLMHVSAKKKKQFGTQVHVVCGAPSLSRPHTCMYTQIRCVNLLKCIRTLCWLSYSIRGDSRGRTGPL